jgi:hypothetical protein
MSPLALWKLHISAIACACTSVVGAPTGNSNVNITISVPEGTSNHGDLNLLCTPMTWLEVLIFFAANFFAHAATVRSLPGELAKDVAFNIFLAILFPFSGIARGLDAIAQRAAWYSNKNDLQTAARAGALCVVVRNELWKPVESIEVRGIRYIDSDDKLVELFEARESVHLQGSVSIADNQLGFVLSDRIICRNVTGLVRLPPGYNLAVLPSNAIVSSGANDRNTGANDRNTSANDRNTDMHISSSSNTAQIIVAIVQVLYALVTLYQTRGDQLNRYGYAAFGLTVLPYITMSIVNLVGNLVTPNYQTMYLISSAELREAISAGAEVEGVFGRVVEESWEDSEYSFTGRHIGCCEFHVEIS